MDLLREFFARLHNFPDLIRWGGLTALTIIVFAETGLLVGFFLPGDSLLVTAGLLAAIDGRLSVLQMCVVISLAAIIGDTVGYGIGRYLGVKLYSRPDSRLFRREHLMKSHAFYEKYGPKTIVLARFVPIVRTFAPTVAGAATMDYRKFVVYNIMGGISWVCSMLLIGRFLAQHIPNAEKNIHWIAIIIIVLSFLPIAKEWLQARREKPSA
ncbi:MAG: VTT domain-containing protein [Elusimicrobia bacterium]|nr:VTT domain-containing protein [Elusimicrobiota bacterium]